MCKGQDHWGGGDRGCNYPGLRVFLGRGCTQTITQPHWPWLWEYSSELYMNVSSIERLDTTFLNFVLKLLDKFVICFFFSVSLPKGTFLKLNYFMSHLLCLYTYVNRSILVLCFSIIFTVACPSYWISHFAVDTCTPKRTYIFFRNLQLKNPNVIRYFCKLKLQI